MASQIQRPSQDLVVDLSKYNLTRIAFWTFFLGNTILLLLDLSINYAKMIDLLPIRRLFNMAREDGLATYFASFQTLCVGGILGLITVHSKISQEPKSSFLGWGFLAFFFSYLAIDDAAGIHERIDASVKIAMRGSTSHGIFKQIYDLFPSYAWQLCFGPFFLFALVFMLKHFHKEVKAREQKISLFLALICYVTAVGFDFFEGRADFFQSLANQLSLTPYCISHLSKISEEFLEMLGTTFFLVAFLQILIERTHTISLRIKHLH